MALLAQLPVDDDMSFQRSCLLKKAAADVSDWEISAGDRSNLSPAFVRRHSKNHRHFPRMSGLSGASAAESQGKINKAHDLIRNGEHPD
jgi:hypothetical protein